MTIPDFVIVGVMRGGTTGLRNALALHPRVHMSPVKELHYFDWHHDRGPGWYSAAFGDVPAGATVGEATPRYLSDPTACARLAADLPDAKLVVSLRNPIDRAYSHYTWRAGRGKEPLSFQDALRAEAAREAEVAASPEPEFAGRHAYAGRSRYGDQLAGLFGLVGRDRVHVMVLERTLADEEGELERLQRFLGLEPDPRVRLAPDANASYLARSPTLQRVGRRLPGPLADVIGRLNRSGTPLAPTAGDRAAAAALLAGERAALAALLDDPLDEWPDLT